MTFTHTLSLNVLVDPFKPHTELCKFVGRAFTSWLPSGPIRNVSEYFVYDFFKIVTMLLLTTFVLSCVRMFIGAHRLRRIIGRHDLVGQMGGAALGVVTPVCSCSVAPLYSSLVASGASLPASATFLFAAPAVNEFAIALVLIALGPIGGGIYVALGVVAALITGRLVKPLGLIPRADALKGLVGAGATGARVHFAPQPQAVPSFAMASGQYDGAINVPATLGVGVAISSMASNLGDCEPDSTPTPPTQLFSFAQQSRAPAFVILQAAQESWTLLKRLAPFLALAAFLYAVLKQFGWTPQTVMLAFKDVWYGPAIATAIGLPLDVNAASAAPILLPLVQAGLKTGTLISLMMAVTVACIPEGVVLIRLLGMRSVAKLFAWYAGYCMFIGFVLNALY